MLVTLVVCGSEFGRTPVMEVGGGDDLHATILHLTHRCSGRDFRLTDVSGEVIHDTLA